MTSVSKCLLLSSLSTLRKIGLHKLLLLCSVFQSASGVSVGEGRTKVLPNVPTVERIEQLGNGNVFWSKKQLELMSPETLRATIETLRNVPDFDRDQLVELRNKTVQVM